MENGNLLLIEKVLLLKSISIFSDTPENILAQVAHLLHEIELDENVLIFNEGDIGNCMYIIYHGTVQINKGNQTLAVLNDKEFFGELSLLDTETRSASATTSKPCFLLRIDQDPFFELLDTQPEIARGVIRILSKRLRNLNEKMLSK
ncbi:MAG: cyclic nucleotide-binding domain-containing protein [Bacteroidia bacterium]|nr:cyclic nucleotide-binding domain-containing protein [Bacteroidia bacterium]HQV00681.1 cyclic nucleotide-binding domain-containing protein [Bacteroidia bacterium]